MRKLLEASPTAPSESILRQGLPADRPLLDKGLKVTCNGVARGCWTYLMNAFCTWFTSRRVAQFFRSFVLVASGTQLHADQQLP